MRGQDAVSTNDSTMRLIDGNQVVAVIIESIMVDPTRAFKFSTEFLGKDPPAKPLSGFDFVPGSCKPNAQTLSSGSLKRPAVSLHSMAFDRLHGGSLCESPIIVIAAIFTLMKK
jgi:hypothetical protein